MRSVLLILLFVLPVLSRQASADDPKVRLQQALFLREPKQLDLVEFKSEVSLELEDLIEGLAVVVPIRVKMLWTLAKLQPELRCVVLEPEPIID